MYTAENISLRIHPRAFAAFGEDLVTNDVVAIIELIKNAYDAYAFKVTVKFGTDDSGEPFISITDDGIGMDKSTILNAWATIATPYKKTSPYIERIVNGELRKRIVSGNKGLGRFSAARLGEEMIMITHKAHSPVLEARFDWNLFENIDNIDDCCMTLEQKSNEEFPSFGTKIIIKKLKNIWNEDKIDDLVNELSRLISPFKTVGDFNIDLSWEGADVNGIKIQPPTFIDHPIYKIEGVVSEDGTVNYTYKYDNGNSHRTVDEKIDWTSSNYKDALELIKNDKLVKYSCGSFSFEFRLWDLDVDSIGDVSERFNIGKKDIRNSIKKYKGISVYRDNVLVLPKSETTRDWLGLDAKRISQIGRRISTSQIIGIVYISNKDNPQIKDTTDREKLADTAEYKQFVEVLKVIIDAFQRERLKDKVEDKKKETLTDLIEPLSANQLLEHVVEAEKKGANVKEIVEFVKDYQLENEKQIKELNERLVYYAQTASLGSVAIVIMHEFLTGLTCIKRFLHNSKKYLDLFDKRTTEYFEDAERSHKRILEVTESFSPLYKRDLRKRKYKTNLNEALTKSVRLIQAKKICKDVTFEKNIPQDIILNMSESELQTIFINLFDNACYWMKDIPEDQRLISIKIEKKEEKLIRLNISDNGIGIDEDDAERIFIPGITAKPKGIGMGLVIVSEIVKSYDGNIGVRIPGDKNGATFIVELPRGDI